MIEKLWIMSMQACVLICVILVIRCILHNYSKFYSYSIWILVLLRLLCPVLIASRFGVLPDFMHMDVKGDTSAFVAESNSDVTDSAHNIIANMVENQESQSDYLDQGTRKEAGNSYISLQNQTDASFYQKTLISHEMAISMIKLIYLLGVCGMAGFFICKDVSMKKKVSAAVRDKADVWMCDAINTPFVMGILKPKIYLPYGLSELEREHILQHERMHLHHGDTRIRFLMLIALCLHWWNPLVWFAFYKACQDMEMYCDEAVMRKEDIRGRKAYATTLLQYSMRQSGLTIVLPFAENNTERRIKNILKTKKKNISVMIVLAPLIVILVFICFTVRPSAQTLQIADAVQSENAQRESVQENSDRISEDDTSEFDIENLYGTWEVTSADTSGIYALSQAEIADYLRTQLVFSENEDYQVCALATDIFLQGYCVGPASITLPDDIIWRISRNTDELSFSSEVYVLNQNTLLIVWDGVFFVAEKK